MAAFASCRRSGFVRVLVVILCAFFIFATLGAPAAQALGVESVAVFGLASVLSAATAALGFKLASNEQGQATLQKMVQDFKTVAWATGFVLVGSKLNGLQNGMDYIKMQVKNGKTYLDSRVFAWVQKWLAENGVYNAGVHVPGSDFVVGAQFSGYYGGVTDFVSRFDQYVSGSSDRFKSVVQHYNISVDSPLLFSLSYYRGYIWSVGVIKTLPVKSTLKFFDYGLSPYYSYIYSTDDYGTNFVQDIYRVYENGTFESILNNKQYSQELPVSLEIRQVSSHYEGLLSNLDSVSSANDTGLSGTDTLGKDVIDLTLDQILENLKEWAQDWFDAGADSATNAATGAQDLPLTVATGAATANPSIAEDGPLVWFPSFGLPIPSLRTGETDTKTVDQGKENASAVETSTVDVAENQSVLDSLVNWALGYISPDTGIFSKFPLCVPYDAYLLVTSSLGVDAVGSDSIFGASPGDLDGVVTEGIETYSDFQPIINIKHDFELDGVTYPLELVIDLRPWQPLVTFFREGMALLLIAELIGAEFKRIRWH